MRRPVLLNPVGASIVDLILDRQKGRVKVQESMASTQGSSRSRAKKAAIQSQPTYMGACDAIGKFSAALGARRGVGSWHASSGEWGAGRVGLRGVRYSPIVPEPRVVDPKVRPASCRL